MAATDLHTRTIIRKPTTLDALISAMKTAFSEELGWTSKDNIISYTPDPLLYFSIEKNSSTTEDEGSGTSTTTDTSFYFHFCSASKDGALAEQNFKINVEFNSSATYYLNYLKSTSGKTVAFNVDSKIRGGMDWIFALDEATPARGAWLTTVGTSSSESEYIYMFNGQGIGGRGTCYSCEVQIADQACVSLSRCPNVWNGALFQELYIIVSAPLNHTILQNSTFYINGKYFKAINNSDGYGGGPFAIIIT